ncbi:MAG: PP2C family serine/threonine-protein phosphatase [Methylovirgula sp.]|uniref:PP2C family serine/threonine-protein phosphatase n=1 Tax=Methylovirgula sp. TaxID=1978224 RepID=UPI0030763449
MAGGWTVASACSKGSSHSKIGTPCQDSAQVSFIETLEGELLIATVSDGAGSAGHSEVGSKLAVENLAALVEEYFSDGSRLEDLDREIAAHWMLHIQDALCADAARAGRQVRDYACTLIGAIVGPQSAAFFQIGDGAIVAAHDTDEWDYVFWPQHGEFANSTNFVSSRDVLTILDFQFSHRRVDELCLFTDGLENLLLHQASRTVHKPFFQSIFKPLRQSERCGVDDELSQALNRYLSSDQICEKTDDDKTLVLAKRL